MLSYLVIGICIFLLIAVIYISAKPISMGIEARRNIKDDKIQENSEDKEDSVNYSGVDNFNISDEIIKLNRLKKEGVITEEEYQQAKKKLLT
tara:strand:- start:441 stop:716 length:276 start_codon:yes stop_codon:yes gene_type:complete